MPEITSVENIRAKLHEFDQRMDAAIAAAKALARTKADAEKLKPDIEDIAAKSKQARKEADEIRLQSQQVRRDFESLKQQVSKALADSDDICGRIRSELDAAIQSLGDKLAEIEERMIAGTKTALVQQADLLARLDTRTQTNADVAANAQAFVEETAARLDGLLASVRSEMQADVEGRLAKATEALESRVQGVTEHLEQEQEAMRKTTESRAENLERVLDETMTAFKEDMQQAMTQHQQAADRQMTDFLNKQNALVQNLSQQIDSFGRASQEQSKILGVINAKYSEFVAEFDSKMAASGRELASLTARVAQLDTFSAEVHSWLTNVHADLVSQEAAISANTARLDQTLDKLKKLPLVGGKFR